MTFQQENSGGIEKKFLGEMKVEILKQQWLLRNFFHIEEVEVRFEKFDGSMSAPVHRLHLERGEASGILLLNTDQKTLVLVKQFRYGAYTTGEGWLTEIATGKIDEGEKPEEAAKREALEETGYIIENLQFINRCFSMPGGSSERLWLYYAEVNNSMQSGKGGGVSSEHEDIQIVEIPVSEIKKQLANITDAKTIIALQWWLLNQDSVAQ
ncbi:MAG: nudix-type nucleoside diphosphatase (YffH/AdpP family) [Limisphaerales bacterium]|jgi:nudix-type nucleoside diphosphatase (YffH/AdpP family)